MTVSEINLFFILYTFHPDTLYLFSNVCRNWTNICIHSNNRIVPVEAQVTNAEVADSYSAITEFVPEL
jgi:hypothetical protein